MNETLAVNRVFIQGTLQFDGLLYLNLYPEKKGLSEFRMPKLSIKTRGKAPRRVLQFYRLNLLFTCDEFLCMESALSSKKIRSLIPRFSFSLVPIL
jgi:hypothetical protein